MNNEELQAAIAANTQAINYLVTEFIRPNTRQHRESMERIDRLIQVLETHAEAIAGVDIRLDTIAQQQQANAKQIASNTEAITRFDARLEQTRGLVAQNSADIAKLTVKQERNAEQIDALTAAQERNAEQIEALAETSRTQLAAIIGNGRRIDRLEQQAS